MSEIDEQRVERAARAIHALGDPETNWKNVSNGYKELSRNEARAALSADADYLTSEIEKAEARGKLAGLKEARSIAASWSPATMTRIDTRLAALSPIPEQPREDTPGVSENTEAGG